MNRVELVKSILCVVQLDFDAQAYFTTFSVRLSAINTYLAKFARYLKLFTLWLMMIQLHIWLILTELGLIHSWILLDYCRRWILSRVYWGRQINWPFQFPPYTLNQPWPSKLFNSAVYPLSHSKVRYNVHHTGHREECKETLYTYSVLKYYSSGVYSSKNLIKCTNPLNISSWISW